MKRIYVCLLIFLCFAFVQAQKIKHPALLYTPAVSYTHLILDHREMQVDYQGCLAINAGDNNLVRNVRFELSLIHIWIIIHN